MPKSRTLLRAFTAVILLLIIAIRLFHFLTIGRVPYLQFRTGDEAYFHDWATAIASGQILRRAAFFTSPLYAYVLGAYYWAVSDQLSAVVALNILMGTASTILISLAARRLAGNVAGLISLALAGLCAAPIFYESFAEKTPLILLLTALASYLAITALQSGRKLHWAMAGAAVGLSSLAHPLLLVLIPAVLLSTRPPTWKPLVTRLTLFLASALLAIAPATVHNFIASKDLVLICSNAGENFYVGNHAGNLTGLYTSPRFSYAGLESEELNFKQEAERRSQRPLKPSEVSSFWLRQGLSETLYNPSLSVARFIRKVRWTLGNEEITDTRNMYFYRQKLPVLSLPLWGFGLVSVLGILSAALLLRDPRFLFCILFSVFYTVSLSLFFVYGRYRLPLLVPLSILAGCAISQIPQIRASWTKWRTAWSLALAAFALWFCYAKVLPGTSESFFIDYYNMGNKYLKAGNREAAAAEYEKALWEKPGDHPARKRVILGLADLYMQVGERPAAERLLAKAMAAFPDDPTYPAKLEALRSTPPDR